MHSGRHRERVVGEVVGEGEDKDGSEVGTCVRIVMDPQTLLGSHILSHS